MTRPAGLAPFLLAAALVATPRAAGAQAASAVSLGLSWSVTVPTNDAARPDARPDLVIRLRADEGLSPSIALHWFSTPVRTTVGGQPTTLGKLNVKPVMGGVSFGRDLSPRVRAEVSAQGGVAFVNARSTGELKQAYGRLGQTTVGVGVSNAFAWHSGLSFWFDLGARYGIVASVGYLGVRPTVTTTTGAGAIRQRVDLGSVVTSVGFAYGVF